MEDQVFLRHLANKHGTGIAARADAAGNHQMAAGLTDAFAQNGQTVPQNLVPAIQELNDLTQREAQLARTTPGARAALAGTGYDPLQVQSRVRELEQHLLTNSAEARNAGAAAELRINQANAARLEQANALTAATFDATVDANLSALHIQTETNREQLTAIDEGRGIRQAESFATQTGKSLNDLTEIFAANDPTMLKEAFGTSDRYIAHKTLRHMQLALNQDTAARVQGMTDAIALNSSQLAGDPNMSVEQLQAMMSGEAPLPEGMTRLAVANALESRSAQIQAQTAVVEAEQAQLVEGAEFQAMVIQSMSDTQLIDTLGTALGGMPTEELRSALSGGQIHQVAAALMAATNDGRDPITLTTASGAQVEVSAQDIIATLDGRAEDREFQVAQTIMNSNRFERYNAEVAENERTFRQTEGLLGVPVPNEIRQPMEAGFAEARALYTQAARAGTEAERVLFEQEAMLAMENSREMLADYATSRGVPDTFIDDIRQGRFSTDETYRAGLLQLADGGSGIANGFIAQSFNDLLRSENITTNDIQAWAASGSTDLTELDRNLTPARIGSMIDGIGYEVLANAALQELNNNEAFLRLPEQARAVLDDATDPRNDDGTSPGVRLSRLVGAIRVADDMARNEDLAAFQRGEIEAPSYRRGSLMASVTSALDNQAVFAEFLTPGGNLDRATASLLTVYIGGKIGADTSGPNAIAFDDLAQVASSQINSTIRSQMVGIGMSDISAPMASIRADRRRLLDDIGAELPRRVSSNGVNDDEQFNAETRQYNADAASIDSAIQTVYMEKLLDPSRDESTFFGFSLPSIGRLSSNNVPLPDGAGRSGGNAIASPEDVADALNRAGRSDLAQRIMEVQEQ